MTRATAPQVDLLTRLMQSHVWSDKERDDVRRALSEGISKERATRLIDRALTVIDERKAAERAPTLTDLAESTTTVRQEDVS